MPQDVTPAEIKAEASSEGTKQFVRRVRRVTRRKFTPEEKVRVVPEGFRGEQLEITVTVTFENDSEERVERQATDRWPPLDAGDHRSRRSSLP